MSAIGTGIAAAVAQTHDAAREQKKIQDAQRAAESERSRAIQEAYEVHLESLGEDEDTSARLHADGQLDNEHAPERHHDLILQYREAIHAENAVETVEPNDAADGPSPRLDVEA